MGFSGEPKGFAGVPKGFSGVPKGFSVQWGPLGPFRSILGPILGTYIVFWGTYAKKLEIYKVPVGFGGEPK